MELLQLRYFVKVAEYEHVSKAAKELNVVQSALSRSIKRLEEDLGTELFYRKGRTIQLNQWGQQAYVKAKEILASVDSLYDQVGNKHTEVIRIGLEAASLVIPRLLSDYRSLHPETEFIVQQSGGGQGCDLVISSTTERPHREMEILVEEAIGLLIPKAMLPRDHTGIITMDQVAHLPFLGLEKKYPLRQAIDDFTGHMGFKPNYVFEADNPGILRTAIHSGMGVAFFPEKTWGPVEDSQAMVQIKDQSLKRWIVIQSHRSKSPIDTLCDFLREKMSELNTIPF